MTEQHGKQDDGAKKQQQVARHGGTLEQPRQVTGREQEMGSGLELACAAGGLEDNNKKYCEGGGWARSSSRIPPGQKHAAARSSSAQWLYAAVHSQDPKYWQMVM